MFAKSFRISGATVFEHHNNAKVIQINPPDRTDRDYDVRDDGMKCRSRKTNNYCSFEDKNNSYLTVILNLRFTERNNKIK